MDQESGRNAAATTPAAIKTNKRCRTSPGKHNQPAHARASWICTYGSVRCLLVIIPGAS